MNYEMSINKFGKSSKMFKKGIPPATLKRGLTIEKQINLTDES
jgi:hypothetical protein